MISDRFSNSFFSFIRDSEKLSTFEKEEVIHIFENKIIQTIFSISLYLIIWSFAAFFMDSFLFTRGVVYTFLDFGILYSFLPPLIFVVLNATAKFIFIYTYTKKRIPNIPLRYIFVGVIPTVGSLFFSAYLLRDKLLFLSVIKDYFIFIKKDFRWIGILMKKNQS